MAKRKLKDMLIRRDEIKEELRLINGSDVDYITPSAKVYCDYGNNMFYKKTVFMNPVCKYYYVSIKYQDKQRGRRVHRLVAEAYLPNPANLPIVMHLDNDKSNNMVSNLKWGTVSENTQQAFDDGLLINDKGFDDSQSQSVCLFDLNGKLIDTFGSISIASQQTGVTKTGISYQCKHKVRNTNKRPKCGFYFRYLDEYNQKGFVL